MDRPQPAHSSGLGGSAAILQAALASLQAGNLAAYETLMAAAERREQAEAAERRERAEAAERRAEAEAAERRERAEAEAAERRERAEAEAAERQREREHQLQVLQLQQSAPASPELPGNHVPKLRTEDFPLLDKGTDLDTFLLAFEKTCHQYHVPEDQWVRYLTPRLRGKALEIYGYLPSGTSLTYEEVKQALVHQYNLTPETYRKKLRSLQRGSTDSWADHMRGLMRAVDQWTSGLGLTTVQQMKELIATEQFLWNCPEDLQQHLRDQKPEGASATARLADEYTNNRTQEAKKSVGWRGGKTHTTSVTPANKPNGAPARPPLSMSGRDPQVCYLCKQPGHYKAMCPQRQKDPEPSQQPSPILCVGGGGGRSHDNLQPVTVGQAVAMGLRDTGAGLTLVRPELVSSQDLIPGKTLSVSGIGGTEPALPIAKVYLDWGAGKGVREVGVSSEIPVSVLLGTDLGRLVSQYVAAETPSSVSREDCALSNIVGDDNDVDKDDDIVDNGNFVVNAIDVIDNVIDKAIDNVIDVYDMPTAGNVGVGSVMGPFFPWGEGAKPAECLVAAGSDQSACRNLPSSETPKVGRDRGQTAAGGGPAGEDGKVPGVVILPGKDSVQGPSPTGRSQERVCPSEVAIGVEAERKRALPAVTVAVMRRWSAEAPRGLDDFLPSNQVAAESDGGQETGPGELTEGVGAVSWILTTSCQGLQTVGKGKPKVQGHFPIRGSEDRVSPSALATGWEAERKWVHPAVTAAVMRKWSTGDFLPPHQVAAWSDGRQETDPGELTEDVGTVSSILTTSSQGSQPEGEVPGVVELPGKAAEQGLSPSGMSTDRVHSSALATGSEAGMKWALPAMTAAVMCKWSAEVPQGPENFLLSDQVAAGSDGGQQTDPVVLTRDVAVSSSLATSSQKVQAVLDADASLKALKEQVAQHPLASVHKQVAWDQGRLYQGRVHQGSPEKWPKDREVEVIYPHKVDGYLEEEKVCHQLRADQRSQLWATLHPFRELLSKEPGRFEFSFCRKRGCDTGHTDRLSWPGEEVGGLMGKHRKCSP